MLWTDLKNDQLLEFEKELLEKFKKNDVFKEFGIYLSTPS